MASRRTTAVVYDRLAPLYDWLNAPMEALGGLARRRRVIARARGNTLEVGVGTGRNLPLYQPDVHLVAVDISRPMLERARGRSRSLGRSVALVQAAAEALPFHGRTFHTSQPPASSAPSRTRLAR